MATLLIVESDRITAELLARQFSSNGRRHETLIATSEDEVRDVLQSGAPDVVLVRHGLWVDELDRFQGENGDAPTVLVNGFHPDAHGTGELPRRVDGVVRGDTPAEDMIRTVETHLSG